MKKGGFRTVFAFTFARHTGGRGWRYMTVIPAILLIMLPALIMAGIETAEMNREKIAENETFVPMETCAVTDVCIIDRTETGDADWNVLNFLGAEGFSEIQYHMIPTQTAIPDGLPRGDTCAWVFVDGSEEQFSLSIVTPENSTLSETDCSLLQDFLLHGFSAILLQKSGLDAVPPDAFLPPVVPDESEAESEPAEIQIQTPEEAIREIFGMIIPYLNVMVLYFMILFYGQGVANSVILEKTSRLMDTFLLSVQPQAMILGKMLATALAGLLQLFVWILSAVGGFALGTALVRAINPQTQMELIAFFDALGSMSGIFSAAEIAAAILIIIAGFLLYCALAAIGGALAGKPEDLSSTNTLFSMCLVVSFLCALYAGGLTGNMVSGASWLDWFPLTAILITPGRVLTGLTTPLVGLCAFGLVSVCALGCCIIAGKLYQMMALYKGNPPKIGKALRMLFEKK